MHSSILPRLVLIVLVTVGVYANGVAGPFLFDDLPCVVNNPAVADLGLLRDPQRFDAIVSNQDLRNLIRTRTFAYLTFALNHRLHGFDPVGFHVVNIGIHAVNGCLVYLLVAALLARGRRRDPGGTDGPPASSHASGVALGVALLFALHPVNTNAVTYVTQRFTSLMALLYLAALVTYLWGRAAPSPRSAAARLAVSLFATLLAMDTKEDAFTLPLAITLVEVIFFDGAWRRRALRLAPFYATMIIIPATLWSAVQAGSGFLEKAARGTALMNLEDLPRASYLFTQFRVIVTYLRILLWPVGLNFDHDYPIFHSFFSAPVVASAAGLALLLAMGGYLLARSRRIDGPCSANHRLGAFGIFFFFLTLSMSSSLIPINDVINEYRVYLPSVGIFLLAASSADSLVRSFGPRGTGVARAAAVAATAVLCLLAGATVARNRVWRDDAGFWQDAWRKSPGKARVASQLAGAYLMQGRTEDAIEILRELIRVKPELAQAHYTLGEMFMAQGRIDDAVAAFERAKAIQSDRPEIYAWLARAYLFQGRLDLSAEALGSLERYEPGSPVLGLMRARLSGSGIAP